MSYGYEHEVYIAGDVEIAYMESLLDDAIIKLDSDYYSEDCLTKDGEPVKMFCFRQDVYDLIRSWLIEGQEKS